MRNGKVQVMLACPDAEVMHGRDYTALGAIATGEPAGAQAQGPCWRTQQHTQTGQPHRPRT